ncbi:hypothetical protein V5799_031141 [Amblyomma americanum]|uniref:Uncharacterized protein n=1 Tax=Amblyomma americanum TaxID=6943 RepID=A0AAQ4EL78_AMBAM
MALEYASSHPVAGALEAAGCRGCKAVCASCGRQVSQLPCFLPPASAVQVPTKICFLKLPGQGAPLNRGWRSVDSLAMLQHAVVPGQPARIPNLQDEKHLLRMPLNKPGAAPQGNRALTLP